MGKRGSLGWARQPATASTAAKASTLVDILDLNGLAGDALRQRRGHEAVEIAIEYVTGRWRRDAGAQVFHKLIRLEHVASDLVPPADVGLSGVGGTRLGFALLQLSFVQASLELLERGRAVLVLGALVLAGDDDSRRDVRDPHGAVGRVHMLPPRARTHDRCRCAAPTH